MTEIFYVKKNHLDIFAILLCTCVMYVPEMNATKYLMRIKRPHTRTRTNIKSGGS